MPDLNASIEEARYALDVLGADGVVLLGNARGQYFSLPEFHPLLEELNNRETVSFRPYAWLCEDAVALHCTAAHCHRLVREVLPCMMGVQWT